MTADNVIDGEFDTQGWNRYMYCHGNPVMYQDPTGHGRFFWESEVASDDMNPNGPEGGNNGNTSGDSVAKEKVKDKIDGKSKCNRVSDPGNAQRATDSATQRQYYKLNEEQQSLKDAKEKTPCDTENGMNLERAEKTFDFGSKKRGPDTSDKKLRDKVVLNAKEIANDNKKLPKQVKKALKKYLDGEEYTGDLRGDVSYTERLDTTGNYNREQSAEKQIRESEIRRQKKE